MLKLLSETGRGVTRDWHDHLPVYVDVRVGLIGQQARPTPRVPREVWQQFVQGQEEAVEAISKCIAEFAEKAGTRVDEAGPEELCRIW